MALYGRRMRPKHVGLALAGIAALVVAGAAVPGTPTRDLAESGLDVECRKDGRSGAVVALGDSITRGLHEPSDGTLGDDSWFNVLACAGDVDYGYNAGVTGDTTEGMLNRLEEDVLSRRPHTVYVMAGTNDVFIDRPPRESIRDLREIIARLRADGITVVLLTLPPISYDQPDPDAETLAEMQRALARELGIGLVDTWPAVARGDGGFRDRLTDDGIHPNDKGAAAIAAAVRRAVLPRTSASSSAAS